jgi:predicted Rossmann fold nucleotide-binding protein DprA/Smf involved in DNA uptake
MSATARQKPPATPTRNDPDTPYVAIVGSRAFSDLESVRRFVQTLPVGTVIVSGGARGVDRCAATAARDHGLRVVEYLAQWDRWGRRAGFIRNQQIVQRCDRLVAFWDGSSSGTRHSIELARQLGRPVIVHRS